MAFCVLGVLEKNIFDIARWPGLPYRLQELAVPTFLDVLLTIVNLQTSALLLLH